MYQTIKDLLIILIDITFLTIVHLRDVKPKIEKYLPDYRHYHNLSRVESHLKEIINKNSHYMKLDLNYRSRLDLVQWVVHITNFSDRWEAIDTSNPYIRSPKVRVFLSYGEHAREFLPVESMFYLLNNLTLGLNSPYGSPAERFSRWILSKIDLFIVTIVNPDGRKYIETTGNYCWRGTSVGVDLNRNFKWNYGGHGSSSNAEDEEFRGPYVFSEPECQVLLDLSSKFQLDAFFSFHSGTRHVYVPFADSKSKSNLQKPINHIAMADLASIMSKVLYTHGQPFSHIDYTADGTIFDYMAGVKKIPFSLAIELWGEGDKSEKDCFDLFNPKSQDLENVLEEIHPLYVATFLYLINWKEKQVRYFSVETNVPSLALCIFILVAVVTLTILVALQNKLRTFSRFYPRRRIISLKSLSSTFSILH